MLIQARATPTTTTTPTTPATSTTADLPSDRAVLRMGWVLILGAVLAILDSTIVNVGLNSAAAELHSSLGTMQWVATGYLLAMCTMIALTGCGWRAWWDCSGHAERRQTRPVFQ